MALTEYFNQPLDFRAKHRPGVPVYRHILPRPTVTPLGFFFTSVTIMSAGMYKWADLIIHFFRGVLGIPPSSPLSILVLLPVFIYLITWVKLHIYLECRLMKI